MAVPSEGEAAGMVFAVTIVVCVQRFGELLVRRGTTIGLGLSFCDTRRAVHDNHCCAAGTLVLVAAAHPPVRRWPFAAPIGRVAAVRPARQRLAPMSRSRWS